ncbi:MAG TPA: 2-amino-4-hydroxy-6-hydroxymethyldihydropteridine diphosphokinase [Bacteroidales bacterium]|jgi:2-amino-4-hydroxy-6-hydroxymethyldihydropteridine diphosphokinase|nr:2-amino-4-hydroxy-6-hydroxymethyldihydropteridine diphosphokinase [Bacteroidales bacterium]HPE41072.1 2-amino-4-hydroxy-6-hydroxymethyldihydropteridine diphosphokinase [Bacteroidales bacterium]
MMAHVFIGLGSNKGDRAVYLAKAIDMMVQYGNVMIRKSSVIETESWGFNSSPFLNQVVLIQTMLSPIQLLEQLKSIERSLGRVQKSIQLGDQIQYHDRTIDLDILLYDKEQITTPELVVPHPEMLHRDFVMIPFKEIADPEFILFINNTSN